MKSAHKRVDYFIESNEKT